MNKNKHDELMGRLKVAQDEIRIVKESLAAEATPEPVVPWEPSGGGFYVDISGTIIIISGTGVHAVWNKAGRTFKTEEEAAKASEFFTFYQRLYQLAEECNAKHTDTGYYHVSYDNARLKWFVYPQNVWGLTPLSYNSNIHCLFSSRESAQEACGIMNRDGWKSPNP